MTDLSETEILDRHKQSLGEAHRACQELARFQDPDHRALRGIHYIRLKDALEKLEGSARQMGPYRGDARWTRLGAIYGKLISKIQGQYVQERWSWFGSLMPLFENGQRAVLDLATRKTGKTGLILPTQGMDWARMADYHPVLPRQRVVTN